MRAFTRHEGSAEKIKEAAVFPPLTSGAARRPCGVPGQFPRTIFVKHLPKKGENGPAVSFKLVASIMELATHNRLTHSLRTSHFAVHPNSSAPRPNCSHGRPSFTDRRSSSSDGRSSSSDGRPSFPDGRSSFSDKRSSFSDGRPGSSDTPKSPKNRQFQTIFTIPTPNR